MVLTYHEPTDVIGDWVLGITYRHGRFHGIRRKASPDGRRERREPDWENLFSSQFL